LTQIKDIRATLSATVKQLSATGGKLADVEKAVAVLREQLLQLPRNNADAATLSKSVGVKLNYVYRAGGQKEFKPLRDGSVLHSSVARVGMPWATGNVYDIFLVQYH
jgi:hypothetical protein